MSKNGSSFRLELPIFHRLRNGEIYQYRFLDIAALRSK